MERLGRRRDKRGEAAEADELVNSSMQANEDRRCHRTVRTFQRCEMRSKQQLNLLATAPRRGAPLLQL